MTWLDFYIYVCAFVLGGVVRTILYIIPATRTLIGTFFFHRWMAWGTGRDYKVMVGEGGRIWIHPIRERKK